MVGKATRSHTSSLHVTRLTAACSYTYFGFFYSLSSAIAQIRPWAIVIYVCQRKQINGIDKIEEEGADNENKINEKGNRKFKKTNYIMEVVEKEMT